MLAVVLALCAAAVFGAGSALQHHAASGVTRAEVVGSHLLARLVRRPGWLVGLCLSGVAFVLHVAALHEGPLSLVQPLVVTTTVFAVLVRSALDRTLPDRAEVVWCVCTCAGLTLFVATVRVHPPHHPADVRVATLVLVVALAAAAVVLGVAGRTRRPARRGFLLALAAGILYGLTAGLIKLATSHPGPLLGPITGPHPGPVPGPHPGPHPGPLLGEWSTWLVPVTGLAAFFLSQRAYQATRLSVSAPVVNIVDVLVAVTFGSFVFADRLFESPGQLALLLVAATMTAVGVWRLVLESERLHDRLAAAAAARADPSSPDPD